MIRMLQKLLNVKFFAFKEEGYILAIFDCISTNIE